MEDDFSDDEWPVNRYNARSSMNKMFTIELKPWKVLYNYITLSYTDKIDENNDRHTLGIANHWTHTTFCENQRKNGFEIRENNFYEARESHAVMNYEKVKIEINRKVLYNLYNKKIWYNFLRHSKEDLYDDVIYHIISFLGPKLKKETIKNQILYRYRLPQ